MGAYVTIGSADVHDAKVALVRAGAWHATLSVDADSVPLGPCAVGIGLGNLVLTGCVVRGDIVLGTLVIRVVGGQGGLPGDVPAQGFYSPQVGQVFSHILQAAGEAQSSTCDPATLGTPLARYGIHKMPAGQALNVLVDQLEDAGIPDATWRVLPDGTVFIGPELWAPSALTDYELMGTDPVRNRDIIYAEDPSVFPGETFNGQKVSRVEHSFIEGKLETTVIYEFGTGTSGGSATTGEDDAG